MTDNKRILIGEIATAHGIKGYVKLRCFAEDETLFETAKIFDEDGSAVSITIKNALKGDWVAQIEGVADRNAAELWRGRKLYIDREALPETDESEFYVEDLKGLEIIDQHGKAVGTVLSVVNYGGGDLVDIKPVDGGESFYLPFNPDTIRSVDLERERIVMDVPESI